MRGRLFLAGVDDLTSVGDVLDVLTVAVMECPGEALQKWRTGLDQAVATARAATASAGGPAATRADRATWGLQPDQIASTKRFLATMGGE